MKNSDSRQWQADDPRRLRMALKRTEILWAARPIFLRDGLGGTTLDRVAAEGKISKMTLYRHFPNKEALFEGLVTDMCADMREVLENSPSADRKLTAEKRLAYELRAFTSGLIRPDWLALYRLLVAEGWRFPDLARVFDESGMRIIRRRICELLEAGGVPANQAPQRAGDIVAVALGDAYQRAILGIAEESDSKAFAQQIDAAVTHGFRATSAPPRRRSASKVD